MTTSPLSRGGPGRLFALPVLLLAACAHHPPTPPPGMARLVLECRWLDHGPGFTLLPYAAVEWDGVPAGTCADWGGDGKLVRAGQHTVAASVTHSNEVEEEGCCGRNHEYVIVREGAVQTQVIGLRLALPPPPDG